tara:strand:- start:91 stop:879 length:789 start_codon:yes stop_codon:yes gene_type:complete
MKILRILIINFFVCSAVFGDIKYQSLPKDVVSGNKYYRIPDGSPFKEHGIQIVDKKDGYPVRAGEKSIRFELRSGDCGKYKPPGRDDCKHNAERHEFHGKDFSKGNYWYAWSIYFPKDYKIADPNRTIIVQIKNRKKFGESQVPPWYFTNFNNGYGIVNTVRVPAGHATQLLTKEQILGQWNDILLNAKWTNKENGFLKVWVNNKLTYEYTGPTKRDDNMYFKFGIYRFSVFKEMPTQVIYFDEVRIGKTKEKVVGKLPPLN